jgi:hypothetical protein
MLINNPSNFWTALLAVSNWQEIVKDYNANKIDGYQAEKQFSTEYKQYLRKKYTYILDMPICIKSR